MSNMQTKMRTRARHPQFRDVHHFQAGTFVCRGAVPFQLDGEDAGDAPVTFSVKPRALRVIVGGTDHA